MRNSIRAAVAALLIGLAPAAHAAGGVGFDVVHQGTLHEGLFCMAADGNKLLAVGAPNLIFSSGDGGVTWAAEAGAVVDAVPLGCILKNNIALVVGQRGLMLRRAGTTWTRLPSVTDARLFAVDVNAAGLAVAVGAFGTILVSSDAGQTWAPIEYDWSSTNTEGFQPHVYGVSVAADGAITIAGEFEAILRSTDRGKSWTLVHTGKASLFDIQIDGNGIGYAVGQDGRVLRSTDGGLTWAIVPSGSKANYMGVGRTAGGQVLITGVRSMAIGSDSAASFTTITPGDAATGWYQAIVAAGPNGWLIGGNSGRVVKLVPGGN
ncbi:hypothetical protein D3874_22345 [Oleomonas cavernae]|uniref:Photosystem II stability/assembly factor-like protein n=1 Tax=Oleomonas cavernae TaxID=2320859 RepID=A0A418WHA3_9PROT|nr:hypothetical protein [Oleomonas cavernae]RJF89375.1 hypothetical protein D3874_22345 [Oleomonas cavernae]